VSYINISGTFYYLCSILDGCSRYIVNWDLRESMTAADIEIILQAAKEKYPEARPRIISDNGPQFIAKDFKEFIRASSMTHVRTSPHYPQSNGKIERWHKSLKGECIRPGTPLSLDDARRLVEGYVEHYNAIRLNSAVGYITPKDVLGPGVRRRSTPRGIGSLRRRENSVRFVGSGLREKARALVSGQFRVTDEVYYCRCVSSRSSSASECWSSV
jgi:transposase InsO family protein